MIIFTVDGVEESRDTKSSISGAEEAVAEVALKKLRKAHPGVYDKKK